MNKLKQKKTQRYRKQLGACQRGDKLRYRQSYVKEIKKQKLLVTK